MHAVPGGACTGGGGRKRAFSARLGGLAEEDAVDAEDSAAAGRDLDEPSSPPRQRRRSILGGP